MVNLGAGHEPVMRRASEAVLEASGCGTSERKIWLKRIKESFMGTWVLDLGYKMYMCGGLFQVPEVRDWGSVCGEGRWVRMRPRSGLALK